MNTLPARLTTSRPKWLVPVAVVVGILLVVVLPLIAVYNGLVDKDTAADNAFADLDVVLQRRVDLIPNLVSTVKAAQIQEQKVFGDLAKARAAYNGAGSDQEKINAAGQVEGAIGRLLVIVENYPELRSNEALQNLQAQLEGTENRVAQARRDYNAVITAYNRSIRRFPRSLFAGAFGFDKRPLFQTTAEDREAPTVDFGDSTSTTAG